MRLRIGAFVLAVVGVMGFATQTWAVAIPLLNPGFEIYNAGSAQIPANIAPDNRYPANANAGAGSGPVSGASLNDYATFAANVGTGDIPAGWTAIGNKPNGTANTALLRFDSGIRNASTNSFPNNTGFMANINSFGSDSFPPAPGIFSQTLVGVSALANTIYTATIEVADMDISKHPSGLFATDNYHVGAKDRTKLMLAAGTTDLGGALEWSDLTPGGLYKPDGTENSGGISLLTLTVLTGPTVPTGDLTISFTAQGTSASPPDGSFLTSTQTMFDNATLDATPFAAPGVPGDYNGNGVVDAADYVLWRNGGPLQNEVSGVTPGSVTVEDYTAWRTRFGNTSGSGSGLGSTAVPESASGSLFAIGLLGLAIARNRITTK